MDSIELYHTLHRQPFQPFRVFVRDGRVYDIRYPRLSVVGTWYFAIGIPLAGQPDPPFYVDHTDFIDLTWIDRIEMLDAIATVTPASTLNPPDGRPTICKDSYDTWETPMDATQLYRLLHAEPFRPFRVHVKDGRVYDIQQPRLSVVGKTYFAIGVPLQDQPEDCDYVEIIDLTMIDRVTMLDSLATAV
jgi:hypothetical protein